MRRKCLSVSSQAEAAQPPAADIARSLPHAAMRAFDQVGRRQALVQAGWNLEPLQREHLLHALPQNASRRSVIVLQLARDLLQPLDRQSTRLNSSHGYISYAVFCLK